MRIGRMVFVAVALWASVVMSAVDCIDYATDPARASLFDLPNAVDFATSGDLGFVVGGALTVLDVSAPLMPEVIGSLDYGHPTSCLALADGRIYTSDFSSGAIWVIDVTDPTTPSMLTIVATPNNITAIDVEAGYAYTVGGYLMVANNYFQVVDVRDLENPSVVAVLPVPALGGNPASVEVDGDRVFMTNFYQGLGVVDVSDPSSPLLSWTALDGWTLALDIAGTTACVGGEVPVGTGVLHVVDIQDPAAPVVRGSVAVPSLIRNVTILGDVAYCGTNEGLAVVSIADPGAPALIGILAQERTLDVETANGAIYSTIEAAGLGVSGPQCAATGVREDIPAKTLELIQIAPNPFNPSTVATFNIDWPQRLTVRIYDARGGLVREIASGWYDIGIHRFRWDGIDSNGRSAPSGAYFFRFEGAKESIVKAVSLVK